jgi:nucleotide-binding universal stress UspA family protein
MTERGPAVNGRRYVVTGVDGTPNSLAALQRAARIARERGAELDAVYVLPPGSDPAQADAGYLMLHMAARCAATDGVVLRPVVAAGDPAEVLIKRSMHAELLVIGGRCHSEHGNLLGGDVVPYCLSHAGCPVDVCADHRALARPDSWRVYSYGRKT